MKQPSFDGFTGIHVIFSRIHGESQSLQMLQMPQEMAKQAIGVDDELFLDSWAACGRGMFVDF